MKPYKRTSMYIVLLLLFIAGMWGSKKEVRADYIGVMYMANGDNVSGMPSGHSFAAGTSLGQLSYESPTRTYYQFLGWSEDKNATDATYQPGNSIWCNRGDGYLTLYAIWQPNGYYTITYNTNGGNEETFTEKAAYGKLSITSVIPTKSRSRFLGWANTMTDTAAAYQAGKVYDEAETSDRTLYAVWSSPTYTVKYISDGEDVLAPQTKYYNEDLVLTSSQPVKTGFTFCGWRTADSSATYMPGDTYTSNASIELYAQWTQASYTISYDVNGGYGGPEAQKKYHGTNITLSDKEPMIDHGQFLGWAKEKDAYRAEFFPGQTYTQDMNITLYAVWDMDQYAIDFNDNGGFYGPGSLTKTHGIALMIPSVIPEKEGYTFLGWATNSGATTPEYKAGSSYTTEGKATLYAVWKKTEAVAGGNTGTNNSGSTGTNNSGSTGTNNSGSTGANNSGSTGTNNSGSAGTSNSGSTGTNNSGTGGTSNNGSTGTNSGGSTGTNTVVNSQPKKQTIQAASKTVVYKSKPFYLKAKTNGGGKLTYKSSNKKAATINSKGKVTVKGYGQTTITITAAAKGNFLKTAKKITIKVVPKKQKLKSVSSPGKKKLNISWTKDKTVTGYEVQFSRRKDFKKETYRRTFKAKVSSTKLVSVPNKRTYYVRIRSYKTVGKKKFYGAWSKLKTVRVK